MSQINVIKRVVEDMIFSCHRKKKWNKKYRKSKEKEFNGVLDVVASGHLLSLCAITTISNSEFRDLMNFNDVVIRKSVVQIFGFNEKLYMKRAAFSLFLPHHSYFVRVASTSYSRRAIDRFFVSAWYDLFTVYEWLEHWMNLRFLPNLFGNFRVFFVCFSTLHATR